MDFANLYAQGFARVAARCLPVALADPATNAAAVIDDVRALSADGVCLAVYPELGLTGYSCGDLFLQDALLDAAEDALATLAAASGDLLPVIVVGAPARCNGRVYDCGVVIHAGAIVAVVPKSHPAEFAESRWFAPGAGVDTTTDLAGQSGVVFSPNATVDIEGVPGLCVFVEVGETMHLPVAPVALAGGATVVVTLAASPAALGACGERDMLVRASSARSGAAHLYATAGPGESTTDAAWDGGTRVYECGDRLGSSDPFPVGPAGTVVDIDLRRVAHARTLQPAAGEAAAAVAPGPTGRTRLTPPTGDLGLRRPLARFPFVPDDEAGLETAYQLQVSALARRLSAVGPATKAVLGVSGGLDSTWALIVAAGAMDRLGRPHSDILGFTMPGFATSAGTKSNAWALMTAIGVTAEELDIRPTATQMMADLHHPADQFDVTFENVQAGLRADYLFRAANQRGGLVVGTGDLSEAALGWCTYGVGDHMSHYDVNAGVPKTLLQHLIPWAIARGLCAEATEVLTAIVGQEISPELVPGRALQSTEDTVGPYALNDAFLFYVLQGMAPSRIAYLVWQTWKDAAAGEWPEDCRDRVAYDLATIKTWLGRFYRRFFASQFKRSCSPDGPQVLGVSLSPRGGWQMPSDATPAAWLAELDRNVPGHR